MHIYSTAILRIMSDSTMHAGLRGARDFRCQNRISSAMIVFIRMLTKQVFLRTRSSDI